MLVYLASVWILTYGKGRRLQEGLARGLDQSQKKTRFSPLPVRLLLQTEKGQ